MNWKTATLALLLLTQLPATRALWTADAAESKPSADLLCRTFLHNINDASVVDTSDRTSQVGEWVATERAKGWTVQGVDLEVAQKPNGFSQGFVQVCLSGSR
jgi:hypothetical protein